LSVLVEYCGAKKREHLKWMLEKTTELGGGGMDFALETDEVIAWSGPIVLPRQKLGTNSRPSNDNLAVAHDSEALHIGRRTVWRTELRL
jgi:hypothetical protein